MNETLPTLPVAIYLGAWYRDTEDERTVRALFRLNFDSYLSVTLFYSALEPDPVKWAVELLKGDIAATFAYWRTQDPYSLSVPEAHHVRMAVHSFPVGVELQSITYGVTPFAYELANRFPDQEHLRGDASTD